MRTLIGVFLFSCWSAAALAATHQVSSPDGKLVFSISDDNNQIAYRVQFGDKEVVGNSLMGLGYKSHSPFGPEYSISKVTENSVDTSWEQPWGERKVVVDRHNELLVNFKTEQPNPAPLQLRVRVFNDGLGFRYEGLGTKSDVIEIIDERTEFNLGDPDNIDAWWIPARGWNRYEYMYETTKLKDIDRVHTPATFRRPDGVHLSIHEAALVDFAAMTLDQRRDGTLRADLTPRSDGLKVKTTGDFKSSWRTIQVSADAVGLLNSDIILNLKRAE